MKDLIASYRREPAPHGIQREVYRPVVRLGTARGPVVWEADSGTWERDWALHCAFRAVKLARRWIEEATS
jgi:hypothetical protein